MPKLRAFAVAAIVGIVSWQASAVPMNMKLSALLDDFSVANDDLTVIRETPGKEVFTVPLGNKPFKIRGGGALVLCEPGQLTTAGPTNGACKGTTSTQVSDVLGFPVGETSVTLYSGPNFPFKLDADSLKNQFTNKMPANAYLAYVEEGAYFDERNSSSGAILDDAGKPMPGVAVYISKKGALRLFEIFSNEAAPEPGSLGLLAGALLSLWGVRRSRPRRQAPPKESRENFVPEPAVAHASAFVSNSPATGA